MLPIMSINYLMYFYQQTTIIRMPCISFTQTTLTNKLPLGLHTNFNTVQLLYLYQGTHFIYILK